MQKYGEKLCPHSEKTTIDKKQENILNQNTCLAVALTKYNYFVIEDILSETYLL